MAAVSEGKKVQDVIVAAMQSASMEDAALIKEAIAAEAERSAESVAVAVAQATNDKEQTNDKGQISNVKDDEKSMIRVQLISKSGKVINPKFSFEKGSVVLVIEPERAFEPGLYTLDVIVTDPLTNEEHVLTQDFAWGVLAMNTKQDRYRAGEEVETHFGVLDDVGAIICDAKLTLTVTSPSGQVTPLRSPRANFAGQAGITGVLKKMLGGESENVIETTGTCGQKDSMSIRPDYRTSFTVNETGTYTLHLKAETANGVREITKTLSVGLRPADGDAAFIISRSAATRLYPVGKSPMTITVEFLEDFEGTVTETVPGGFEIDIEMQNAKYEMQNDETIIEWSGSWKAGEIATFSYLYDAPDISPQFFLMGPLELTPTTYYLQPTTSLREARAWEIANDDITWIAPPGPGKFTYKKKLTIANAQVDEDLTDFPLLVKIANDADFKSTNVQADGDDIRFTTATGMTLPFETEEFHTSTSSGSGLFWVKIPTIKSSANSSSGAQIYVLYGSGTAVNGQNAAAVWSNGFAGVWHMSGSTLSTRDSTANGNHGTNNGAIAAGGKVDGAAGFDGTDDSINLGDINEAEGSGTLTVSAWIQTNTLSGGDSNLRTIIPNLRISIASDPCSRHLWQIFPLCHATRQMRQGRVHALHSRRTEASALHPPLAYHGRHVPRCRESLSQARALHPEGSV